MMNSPVNTFSVTMGNRTPKKPDNKLLVTGRNLDILPPSELAIHGHPHYVLTYVLDCDDYFTHIDNCKIEMKKNHIYFSPPNTLHPATNRLMGCQSGISLRFHLNDADFLAVRGELPFCAECCDEVKNLFLPFGEYAKKEPSDKIALNKQVTELIDAIFSKCQINYIKNDSSKSDDNFIGLIKYMYDHINENLTLSELAAKVYLHPSYFSRKFKALYKITPMNYLYSVKLTYSLDKLSFTNNSVSAIAESIGFGHVASFCSAFRRAYGLSPSEYREKAKKTGRFEVSE